jgi:hypothetical protein
MEVPGHQRARSPLPEGGQQIHRVLLKLGPTDPLLAAASVVTEELVDFQDWTLPRAAAVLANLSAVLHNHLALPQQPPSAMPVVAKVEAASPGSKTAGPGGDDDARAPAAADASAASAAVAMPEPHVDLDTPDLKEGLEVWGMSGVCLVCDVWETSHPSFCIHFCSPNSVSVRLQDLGPGSPQAPQESPHPDPAWRLRDLGSLSMRTECDTGKRKKGRKEKKKRQESGRV